MHNFSPVYFVKHVHVSGVSTAHHQEVYRMDTPIGTYWTFQITVCCPGQDNRLSSENNKNCQLLYQYGVLPDDGL